MEKKKKHIRDFSKRKGRKIVVNGVNWVWRIGKCGGVAANCEDGKSVHTHAATIKGMDPSEWEESRRDRSRDFILTPCEVAEWLKGIK